MLRRVLTWAGLLANAAVTAALVGIVLAVRLPSLIDGWSGGKSDLGHSALLVENILLAALAVPVFVIVFERRRRRGEPAMGPALGVSAATQLFSVYCVIGLMGGI